MNYDKKTLRDIDVSGKKVLLRCDLNVPYDKKTGVIEDETRIVESVPTLRYLLDNGAAVILLAHLGRPKGAVKPEMSLSIVKERAEELFGCPITLTKDVLGPDTLEKCAAIQPGQVVLLENIRFRPEEEKNDPAFARELASLADLFVFDAFGTAHRAHASTEGVAHFLPAYAGILLDKELTIMGGALTKPQRPLVAILGGSKVSDKIGVINNLLNLADTIIVGGGMAYTFQQARGGKIGTSLLDADHLDYAKEMLVKAEEKGVKLLLPVDSVVTAEYAADAPSQVVPALAIPDDKMGMDIGPETVKLFCQAIENAGTVIWNGPMGVFEFPAFAKGTNAIAKAMAEQKNAITIVGGGDSASAVEKAGYAEQITHISTGGGAALEFLEGLALPGVVCLLDK